MSQPESVGNRLNTRRLENSLLYFCPRETSPENRMLLFSPLPAQAGDVVKIANDKAASAESLNRPLRFTFKCGNPGYIFRFRNSTMNLFPQDLTALSFLLYHLADQLLDRCSIPNLRSP